MYGEKIKKILEFKKIKEGDAVILKTERNEYKGIIMPRIGYGDKECLILKLTNGYNVGIEVNRIIDIKKTEGDIVPLRNVSQTEDYKIKGNPEEEIVILGCGGTIASKIEYRTGAVYPAITTEELIQSFPQLKEKKIRTRMLFSLLSENMTPKHWTQIANAIKEEIEKGCKGIVLMHGTDTMHYTAAALSYMIKTPVPIVMVGAQRSSDRGSSDNMMNLMSALIAAESDIAEITVCMHATENDDYCYLHRGTKVRKMHTSRRDAFKTINGNPIARIYPDEDRIEIISSYEKRGKNKLIVDTELNPNVALIYVYPGMKTDVLDSLIEHHEGAVLIGTGLGHIPTQLIDVIKKHSDKKPIVISSQTINGRLNMNVYETGRQMQDAGVIGHLMDWTPEAAFVKLMYALAHADNLIEVRKIMETNLSGEITERNEE
ncbi:MAG: Glu-tRNA(Gln) amidotransferase subunit GatD [Candidatus Micrarchaeota archaeon]|nr:Glu-tRNA(Gln) amidotransferase subunit GatD [Candidatus Micrarchaeota archaeon]